MFYGEISMKKNNMLNRLLRVWPGALLGIALLLGACGGPPPDSVTAVIGAAGGTLTHPDGVQVTIPPGALNQATTIGIARSSAGAPPTPEAYPVAGFVYELTPHGVTFNNLVTVRAPLPAGTTTPQVFMASQGEGWKLLEAQVVNGMAEWQRNSFSNMFIGLFCSQPPAMNGDPFWCIPASSYATVAATPAAAMVRTGPIDLIRGDMGSRRVDQAATLQFTTRFGVPGNCSNVTADLRRFTYVGSALRYWSPPIIVQTKTPALTVSSGGGRLVGSETFDFPIDHTLPGQNRFSVVIHFDCPEVAHSNGSVSGWNYGSSYSSYVGDGLVVTSNVPMPTVFFTVGGAVSGLTGSGLVLQNNGGDKLSINTDGNFTFNASAGAGGPYAVTVLTPPTGQSCTVQNGSGTANANVTNVAVSCVAVAAVKAWQGAALLEADAGAAYDSNVVFDANGNGMAIWTQNDGTYLRIQSRRYIPSSGWGTVKQVDNGSAAMAMSPKIAADGLGNLMAVWLQTSAGVTSIWTNLYSASSGWGTAALLETVNPAGGNKPEIAMDSAGNAIVVWYAFDGSWTSLWAKRYAATGGWSAATLIENVNTGGASEHSVAMDANGNAMVVWAQFDGTRSNIMANRYTAGSGWGTAGEIDASDLDASNPSVAVDSAGNMMAVWHQRSANTGNNFSIYTNRFSNGSWGAATLVKADIPYARQSAIAMNASGNAMLVWLEDDGFDTGSIWARAYAGGIGGAIVRIDDLSIFTDGRTPKVGIDASGNAVALWGQGRHIWSARYLAGSGWLAATDIDSSAATFNANQPQIAVDSNGNALAVWERSASPGPDVWGNIFK
jgi:hypothetical protein